jgi:endoglycosylceramidase
VAERFAGRTEVAGYDLLNEPETSRPSSELTPLYDELLSELISAIRQTGSEQLIFLEPTIPAGNQSHGLVLADPGRMGVDAFNLVGATHNYAESIDATGLTLELTNTLLWVMAESQGTGVWIGEYGFWSTTPETLEIVGRYAADEDAHAQGGAWWQWRQPCGDPHSLERVGDTWQPIDTVIHLHAMDCTTQTEIGPTDAFLSVLGRGYPRVAPGERSGDRSAGSRGPRRARRGRCGRVDPYRREHARGLDRRSRVTRRASGAWWPLPHRHSVGQRQLRHWRAAMTA